MTISNGSLADSFSVNSESGAAYESRGLSWTKSLSETDSEQMHLQSIEIDGSRVKSEITDTIGTSVSNQTSFSAGLGFEAGASGLDTTLMKSETPETGFSSLGVVVGYEYFLRFGNPEQPQSLVTGISLGPTLLRQDFSGTSSVFKRRLISAGNNTQEFKINQFETKLHLVYRPFTWFKFKLAYASERYDQSVERLNEVISRANLLKTPSASLVNSIESLSSSFWKVGVGFTAFTQWVLDLDMIRYKNLLDQSETGNSSATFKFRGTTWEPSVGVRRSSGNNSDFLIFELAINY
ncbi:MAG: hypothetical protein IPK04_18270 [Bdellovibrionales bacterium]|nr:hypothetical protein [Bdellovibrionales bacterium]